MQTAEFVVFDFDHTLYKGDCSVDFFKFVLRKKSLLSWHIPLIFLRALQWKFRLIDTNTFKENFFSFLNGIDEAELQILVKEFWSNKSTIHFHQAVVSELKNLQHHTTVIITASPQILVEEANKILGADYVIGTLISLHNKQFKLIGNNCKGIEKVNRFKHLFGAHTSIAKAYSDNVSDQPLFDVATKAFFIKNGIIKSIK
jgi:phosphatidylglycerophosphatase C